MIINQKDIIIPPWISTHTYFYNTDKSRTYINNEKRHTYLQLDGLSSDFWYLLVQNDLQMFDSFINRNDLANQVKTFIDMLEKQGLIIYDLSELDNIEVFDDLEIINKKSDEDLESKFIQERNDWLLENNFLASLFFELTYRCNLKCVHCYNPKNISYIEIPFEKIKEIIDDAYDIGVFKIILSGGESTTYTRFIELVKYIRYKKMSVEIFTNGQLLAVDDALYNELVSIYPHQICLSLYSTKKEKHENVTGIPGSYKKTYELIKKLRSDNVTVQIKNFLLNFTCDDCINVKNFADSIGANDIADLSLIPTIEGDKKTFEYVVDDNNLFELYVNPESPLYIGENPKFFDIEENKDTSPCLGGYTGLCVSPTLDVNICVSMPKPLANLNNISLKDLWNGAVTHNENNELYKWQKITNSDLKECYKHEYCKFCHYCAGMAFLENGYLKKSDILCKQAIAKFKAYAYLKKK